MHRTRNLTVLLAIAALLAACSDDTSSGDTTNSQPAATTSTQPAATSTTAGPTTTVSEPVVTTTEPAEVEQLAIWPAADVVFTTPEAAATDFVTQVFGDGPVLGEFQAGDQRSGEIEVFASVDGAPIGNARSTLLLRQLGPADGWFVLAAVNESATITVPESGASVDAVPITVEGVALGFEATVVVSALVVGRAEPALDQEVTMAGNFDGALPYSVILDLSDASPGDVVMLLVRGGVGLETDPGDFGAIPVLVGSDGS